MHVGIHIIIHIKINFKIKIYYKMSNVHKYNTRKIKLDT